MTNFIDDVVAGRIELPTMPRTIQQLLVALRDPSVNLSDVVRQIEQDPAFCAHVLRLANSPFFSGRRTLASVQDAVAVIGVKALQTLVLSCGVSAAFIEVPGVNLSRFWGNAIVTANSARILAQRLKRDPEIAYCAGLLSNIGHLILCQAFPENARAAFKSTSSLSGQALAEQERAAFGTDHAVVGGLWADQMDFPQEVGKALTGYLDRLGPGTSWLNGVLHLANEISTMVTAQESLEAAIEKLDVTVILHLDLDRYVADGDFAEHYTVLGELSAAY
ncbi:MAG: HDOD domain-containing protein [Burkholderiaceae bacterium]